MTEIETKEGTIKTEDTNSLYGPPLNTSLIEAYNELNTKRLEIATESIRIFNEYILKLTKFNMSVMRMSWTPFLYFPKQTLENQEKTLQ